MLIQLLAIGYVLTYIFEANQPIIVFGVLTVMVLVASWISLRTIPQRRVGLFGYAVVAVLVAGGATLAVVSQGVLSLRPWYAPRYLIPLAGMLFSNCMNTVSLSAERFFAERARETTLETARNTAFQAALIPITNSLFEVGLVSIPGMMTGQVLAGVDPLIAARYQIMVMCMIYGSSGISAALFLLLVGRAESRADL